MMCSDTQALSRLVAEMLCASQAVQAQHAAQQQANAVAQEAQAAQTHQLHARLKLMEDWATSQAQVSQVLCLHLLLPAW